MELSRHLRHVRLKGRKPGGDHGQEWCEQDDTHQPVEEIPGRQPIAGRVAAPPALEHGIDGAAEVCAQDQRHRRHGRDEIRIGGCDPACRHVSRRDCARLAGNAHRGRRYRKHAEVAESTKSCWLRVRRPTQWARRIEQRRESRTAAPRRRPQPSARQRQRRRGRALKFRFRFFGVQE